jgi:hypothetical protein
MNSEVKKGCVPYFKPSSMIAMLRAGSEMSVFPEGIVISKDGEIDLHDASAIVD